MDGQVVINKDSINIEIINPNISSGFTDLFIWKEIIDSNYSGVIKLKSEIPFKHFNDLDFGDHYEDYDNTPLKINVIIEYNIGVKTKIVGYYENGIQFAEVYMNEKGRNGTQKYWYDNGQIEMSYMASNGKIVSPVIKWYKNGMLKSFQDESGSKKITKEWYKNGMLASDIIYPDTFSQSFIEKSYYDNGNPLMIVNFNNERQPFRMYYKNRKLFQQGDILGRLLAKVGKWEEWYENGQVKQESYYHDSIPNYRIGTWKYWNEKGELIKEEKYENGELVDTKEYLPMKIKNN